MEKNAGLLSREISPAAGPVLTKAVGRAAEVMGLRQAEVTEILGLSAATVSRLMRGDYTLRPAAKEFELAALLVRVFRSLDAIAGGDQTVMRAWLRAPNSALRAVPAEAIKTVTGLAHVVAYLDSRRAPL